MSDIIYTLKGGVYLNITNQCPCACEFCIRKKGDAVGDAQRLWHDREPNFEAIRQAIDSFDFSGVREVVFCGYGEPTCAYDNLIRTAKYLKEHYDFKIRLNTNGLSDLINGKSTAKEICRYIDVISVSLNSPDEEKFLAITKSRFGRRSYQAMLDFTKECVVCGNTVRMTVVDVIPQEDIEKSRAIAESLGAQFVCRSFAAGR